MSEKLNLADFAENPDNPRTISGEDFERLVAKLRRVPSGLTANRIAFVSDHPAGKFVVLSGNTRLRALKRIFGSDAEVPSAWFQDVTSMSPEQRKEFIVAANKSDGDWDLDKLLEQYGESELADLLGDDIQSMMKDEKKQAEPASDDAAAEETPVKNFVMSFFLVSVPIERAGEFVDYINALKKKGAQVDEQLG